MANIEQIIEDIANSNKIKTGKEMRAKLYEFANAIYEDASKKGNANMEVAQARGVFDTLNQRLNNSDTEMSKRKNVDSDLQSQINGLASGSPLVASSVSEMTDTSHVYVNTTDGHWYWYNETTWIDGGVYQATEIETDKTLRIEGKVADAKASGDSVKSIFNGEIEVGNMINGYYINRTTGDISSNATSSCTDFIEVIPNKKILISNVLLTGTRSIWCYDENKFPISSLIDSSNLNEVELEIPSNAKYIRATAGINQVPMIRHIEILKTKLNDINNKIKNVVNEIFKIKEVSNNYSYKQRFKKIIKPYKLPSSFDNELFPIKIYTDCDNYFTDFDVSNYKNEGGTTYYVSPSYKNGSSKNNGITPNSPVTLQSILNSNGTANISLKDGDTIIFEDGIYRDFCHSTNYQIEKNVNLIAQNQGKAIIASIGDLIEYTSEGNNVYYSSNVNIYNFADKVVQLIDEDDYSSGTPLTKVDSLAECEATEGTYYYNNNVIHVHLLFNRIPTYFNTFVLSNYLRSMIHVVSNTQPVHLYMEGLKIFGGMANARIENSSKYANDTCFYAKNCDFLFATDSNMDCDAVMIQGAKKVYLQNCCAKYSSKDGFNYHKANDVKTSFIEINCVGANNGIDGYAETENVKSMNGSTSHDGVKGIRFNSVYYNNYGSNVADVNDETETINIQCVAFDSAYKPSNADGYACDYCCQQTGATMHLLSCRGFGSLTSLYVKNDNTAYVKNCELANIGGSGNIIYL